MRMDYKNIRAIVVEDDACGMALLGVLLRRLGMDAYIDPTGKEVISLAQQMQPHMIFLDIQLPHRNGFDIISEIKQNPKIAHIPVVALTALDPSTAIPKCKALGFSGYISKPLRSRYFVQQLERILAGDEVWDDEIIPLPLS